MGSRSQKSTVCHSRWFEQLCDSSVTHGSVFDNRPEGGIGRGTERLRHRSSHTTCRLDCTCEDQTFIYPPVNNFHEHPL
jgi:hypothetical protein